MLLMPAFVLSTHTQKNRDIFLKKTFWNLRKLMKTKEVFFLLKFYLHFGKLIPVINHVQIPYLRLETT